MDQRKISRRNFLAQSGAAGAAIGLGIGGVAANSASAQVRATGGEPRLAASARNVAIIRDPQDRVASAPPVTWAIAQVSAELTAKKIAVRESAKIGDTAPGEFCIVVAGSKLPWLKQVLEESNMSLPNLPETLAMASAGIGERTALVISGTDARALVYGLLDAADRIRFTDPPLAALRAQRPIVESAANRVRSVARLFTSQTEDTPWFRDKAFWNDYLTMLVRERFNRFNLSFGLGYDFARQIRDADFYFAYPFLVDVPKYKVRAVGLAAKDRDENLAMLRFISDEAAKRGLDFQLGLWTHAYQWTDSPEANYTIDGVTADNHAAYCRDALAMLLKECPAISGVTLRTHGESGVAEGNYDFWKTIFGGIAKSGRKVEIDLHAKGIDQKMIDTALATGLPVNVSPKFAAEHAGLPYHQTAIRSLEMPPKDGSSGKGLMALSSGARKFMRYSYGDLLRDDRKYGVMFRVWPGTQRLLLSGDPVMAAAMSRAAGFCGSAGLEICEPLSFKGRKGSGVEGSRTAYQDKLLVPPADWEKYECTYRLSGRMLFNPDSPPETWQRMMAFRWGQAAPAAEKSLATASRILPLVTSAHLPSAANAHYWPEIYTNMSMCDASAPSPFTDTPSPKLFGTVSPLDPALFLTIDESADELLSVKSSGKYSSAEVAAWLLDLADTSTKHVAEAKKQLGSQRNAEAQRAMIDTAIQAGLGRFFAHKFRAGVLFAIYQQTGDKRALAESIKQYKSARDAWAELAKSAERVYVRDITFGPEDYLRGHWSDRLAAIDEDIARLQKLSDNPEPSPLGRGQGEGAAAVRNVSGTLTPALSQREREKISPKQVGQAIDAVLKPSQRTQVKCEHQPAKSFSADDALLVELKVGGGKSQKPAAIVLKYRHVNQAENWQTAELRAQGENWTGEIPGEYTKTPFPIQYFFELHFADGKAALHPGLDASLCNTPYFVVPKV